MSSPYDEARDAVAALARAAARVREASEAIGACRDPGLEFDLDELAGSVEDALVEFGRSCDWPGVQA